jgi:hypothetical protein
MDHFAGLDVSIKETSICIVDDTGRIVREVKVASAPEPLLQVLTNPAYHFKRIGLEAGPLSQWLFSVLAEAGLPVKITDTGQQALAGSLPADSRKDVEHHRNQTEVRRLLGRQEQLEGKIQERYGLAKDEAKREVETWFNSLP